MKNPIKAVKSFITAPKRAKRFADMLAIKFEKVNQLAEEVKNLTAGLEQAKQSSRGYYKEITEIHDALFSLRNLSVTIETNGLSPFELAWVPSSTTLFREQIIEHLAKATASIYARGKAVSIRCSEADPVIWLKLVKDFNAKFEAMEADLTKAEKINKILADSKP